ncbi:MAG: nucleotidyltransferase family protein [Eubacteriales bacterium]|nr:nucleotidyltransferase family protein [Eubacteriales bacterium]
MRQLGLIAEYNPLHLGHLSQIRFLREKLGADASLTVALASNFCQRGAPALLDAHQRARMAIQAGADLVLLFPQAFSASEASAYAKAGVNLLTSSGVVRILTASSELFDKDLLEQAAGLISPESEDLRLAIRKQIAAGKSPHVARSLALEELGIDSRLIACFQQPNSRLVLEYMSALKQSGKDSNCGFFLCQRQNRPAETKSNQATNLAWSASAIRDFLMPKLAATKALVDWDSIESLSEVMPASSLAVLLTAWQKNELCSEQAFIDYAKLLVLRVTTAGVLSQYRYMESGLAERLFVWARESNSILEAQTRNFSPGRIRRALLSLCLGISQDDAELYLTEPAFIYPLAFNKQGKYLLRKMRERATLPVIGRFSEALNHSDPQIRYQAEIERRAWALYAYLRGKPDQQNKLLEPAQELKSKEKFN